MIKGSRSKFLALNCWLVVVLVGAIALIRLAPYLLERFAGFNIDPTANYPWNFVPVMAISLFGAARFAGKIWMWVVPLAGCLLGELGIYLLKGQEFVFLILMPFVYGAYAVGIGLGLLLRKTERPLAFLAGGLGGGVLAEVVFFLMTNFGAWMLWHNLPPTNYTFDLSGLMTCYVAGLPFLYRSIAGTSIYGVLLFGGYVVVRELRGDRRAVTDGVE